MIDFKGKHFGKDIILLAVRWYFAYALSYRDIEELLKERGVEVDHATINRWVIEFGPQLSAAFKKRKSAVNGSWRMDETYIKIKGKWYYQYRAVDKHGCTIDFLLCKHRDTSAAYRFFKKAIRSSGLPEKVTIDKSGSNIAALELINKELAPDKQITVRQIKYLNNIVEQDHRFIKKITKPMKGFKSFNSARATLAGIELHHMLRKRQHITGTECTTVWDQFYGLAA
jgi:putative transposase